MIQRGTNSLINPSAIFLCKKNLIGGQETINGSEDYFISYKLSSDKFVGWIGDFAEYKSMHFPDKVYYNNIPRLELLNESEQDSIGYDQSTLELIEKYAVFTNIKPSIEHQGKTLNRFLPKYFGTAIDKGNTVLMFIIPPDYKSAYIFNGGSISSIYSYYKTNIVKETTDSSYVTPFPKKLSTRTNNVPNSEYHGEFTELDESQAINIFSKYNEYIVNNSALSLESDNDDELNYYRLVKIVIIPSKNTEETEISINFVNLGYRTSENPYRNLDKYLLREEGFVQKYEFNPDNSVGHDLTSGTCIPGEKTLSLGLLDTWTNYWRPIVFIDYNPAEEKFFSYGDFILVGSNKQIWKYVGYYESQSKPGSWSSVNEGPENYWQPSETYAKDTIVKYDGNFWKSEIDNNTGNYPGAWKDLGCTVAVDTNSDDEISKKEWEVAGNDEDEFDEIDTNSDGKISKKEWEDAGNNAENNVTILHSTDVNEYNFSEGIVVKYEDEGSYWEAKKDIVGNIIPKIYQKDFTYYSETNGIKHYYYKLPYKKNDLVILNNDIWLSLIDDNKGNLPGFSTAWKKKPIYNFMDAVKITLITSSGETWTVWGKILSVDFYYKGIHITEMLELTGLGFDPFSDSNITLVELNDSNFVYQVTIDHYNRRTIRCIFSKTGELREKISSLFTITFKITSA